MSNLNILALETSTEACSVALYTQDKIFSRYKVAPQKHAELLLNYCDELLSENNLSPENLSAIAFGRGPGSFTGVRIATAAAQGIAIAHHIPVIAVSSLQILAQLGYKKFGAEKIYAGIDARMGEVYFGEYELNKKSGKNNNNFIMELIGEERVGKLENLQLDNNKLIPRVGSAFQQNDILFPHAEVLLEIALEKFNHNQIISAELAMPVYLRDNVVL